LDEGPEGFKQSSRKVSKSIGLSDTFLREGHFAADGTSSVFASLAERDDGNGPAVLFDVTLPAATLVFVEGNGLFSYFLLQILSNSSLLVEESTGEPSLTHARLPKLCIWAISSVPQR
jgi:hypothetical protein